MPGAVGMGGRPPTATGPRGNSRTGKGYLGGRQSGGDQSGGSLVHLQGQTEGSPSNFLCFEVLNSGKAKEIGSVFF